MADVRIEFQGLTGFAIEDDGSLPNFVTRIVCVFADPWLHGLHPHAPRLVFPDANVVDWTGTNVPPMLGVSPLSFDLSRSLVALLPDDKATQAVKVATPPGEVDDPDDQGQIKLGALDKLLDLKAICEDDVLKPGYFGLPHEADLHGRLVIDFGTARTKSDKNGEFDEWRFALDGQDVHKQEASDILVWRGEVQKSLTILLRSLDSSSQTSRIRVNCPDEQLTRFEVRHTCEEKSCGPHRGVHVPVFYEMVTNAKRRPTTIPPSTEGGYCPPGRFSR